MVKFILNETPITTDLPPGTIALDYIRQEQGLIGTKEGCREGDCGACMILVGELKRGLLAYKAVNSCLLPLGELNGRHVVTIEGLNSKNGPTPIQQAILDEGASQCGFCTPGFVVSMTGYLLTAKTFEEAAIINAVAGNICRCTGYLSIIRAIQRILNGIKDQAFPSNINFHPSKRIDCLIAANILPAYFAGIREILKPMAKAGKAIYENLPSTTLIAGGTDLYSHPDIEQPPKSQKLVLLSRQKKMQGVYLADGQIHIGAATTLSDITESEILNKHIPNFSGHMCRISSLPIRQRATIGGNIVNASPIGDMSIILLALNARLTLISSRGERQLELKHFFKGYKHTDLHPDELVTSISFPCMQTEAKFNYEKVAKRAHLDIATVNSAILIKIDNKIITEAHISAGGVSPIPLYLAKCSAYLNGRNVSIETVCDAARIALDEINPVDDVRGSANYKRLLLRQIVYAHFVQLFPYISARDLIK